MSATHLSVVSTGPHAASSMADRIRKLQAEAQALARDHVSDLERALETVASLANEISSGGDAYPIGARDLCRRLAEDSNWRAQTLGAILQKN